METNFASLESLENNRRPRKGGLFIVANTKFNKVISFIATIQNLKSYACGELFSLSLNPSVGLMCFVTAKNTNKMIIK